jgi:LacI family transcriptional regulator
MVLIPGDPDIQDVPSIDIANIDGAFEAVDYLSRLGHCQIVFLNGPMNFKYSVERFIGYRKALKKNHLPYQKELIWEIDFTQEGGYAGMKNLLFSNLAQLLSW